MIMAKSVAAGNKERQQNMLRVLEKLTSSGGCVQHRSQNCNCFACSIAQNTHTPPLRVLSVNKSQANHCFFFIPFVEFSGMEIEFQNEMMSAKSDYIQYSREAREDCQSSVYEGGRRFFVVIRESKFPANENFFAFLQNICRFLIPNP